MAFNRMERYKAIHELEKILGITVPKDGLMMAATCIVQLDIIALDEKLSANDSEYNNSECTYKGKACSMKEYINRKFGERAVELINLLTLE
jgi:hypothetical protein